MSFNNTDYLHLELCTKIITVTEELTLVTASYGFYWNYSRKVDVIHQHFVFIYTRSNTNSEIFEKPRLSIIPNRINTGSVTLVSSQTTSSKGNRKGINKPLIGNSFIAEKLIGLHNKDPPFVYFKL